MINIVKYDIEKLQSDYSRLVMETLNYFNSQHNRKYRIVTPEEFRNDLKEGNIIGEIRIEKMGSEEIEKNFIEILGFPVTNITVDTRWLVDIEDKDILISYYTMFTNSKISAKIKGYLATVENTYNVQFEINISYADLKVKCFSETVPSFILGYYLFILQHNTIRGVLENESKSKLNLLIRSHFKGKFTLKRRFSK